MGTISLKTTSTSEKHWGFLIGRTSAQLTSAVSQNESESRFTERFAESAPNPQFHEPFLTVRSAGFAAYDSIKGTSTGDSTSEPLTADGETGG